MTRYYSLPLVLFGASLLVVGCGGSSSSSSNKDATPVQSDGHPVAADGPNVLHPDAILDLAPVTLPDGPLVAPDAPADRLPVAAEVGPIVTPDAAADSLPVAAEVGPVTPDAPADRLPVGAEVGPVVTPDAAADSLPVAAEAGPVVTPDATADSLPVGAEVGPIVTPDAAADQASPRLDTGPIATVDAATDSPADAAGGGGGSGGSGGGDGSTTADGGADADDSGTETDSLPVACFPFVGGVVVADLTLTQACSPYTISDYIEINDGAILTVEPGVTLAFEGGVGLDVGASSVGKLVAVGTAQSPIIFTSSSNPPLPGDWRAIHLWDGTMAGTKIAYAKLDYCGADRNGCIVGDGVQANLVTLDHLTIGHVGPDSDGILEYDTNSNFIITNSIFNDIAPGQYAISVQAPSFAGIGTTNTFNGGAMIEVAGGTISTTTSWADPGTSIAVTSDTLFVEGPDNPVFTLGPGLTLAFDSLIEFDVGFSMPGKLVVAGTPSNHVVMTSLAAAPGQGDWVGVAIWENGTAQVSYADISYAGSDGSNGGDLILRSANTTAVLAADHSSFTYSQGYGIYLDCADPTVTQVATVTIDASNTYAHNDSDMTHVNDQALNVGPGLNCTHRLPKAKLAPRGRTR